MDQQSPFSCTSSLANTHRNYPPTARRTTDESLESILGQEPSALLEYTQATRLLGLQERNFTFLAVHSLQENYLIIALEEAIRLLQRQV